MSAINSNDEFLQQLYFHLGGDPTIWEMDVYTIGKKWGYTDDEIDSFLDYWETKRCIEVTRTLGAETVAVRLTLDGLKCVRDAFLL
ncbi:MAG TPA: hypothetical protein VEG44_09600 [Candidatus Acidoferrales bacterium]|nr:hypothetical protein [Candidatus Acidoferrales bacterium]